MQAALQLENRARWPEYFMEAAGLGIFTVPGQTIELAVFGINGPISYTPENFIWIKSATLDFYRNPKVALSETPAKIIRNDPALDDIVPLCRRLG